MTTTCIFLIVRLMLAQPLNSSSSSLHLPQTRGGQESQQKHERASKTALPLFRLFHLIACLLGPSLLFAQAVLAMESASECPLSSRPKATDWPKKQDSVHLTGESLMSS